MADGAKRVISQPGDVREPDVRQEPSRSAIPILAAILHENARGVVCKSRIPFV
jgi:hypothetical protein